MKAHMVVKVYSTGTSAIADVFSSKKKAQAYVGKVVGSAKLDGWEVSEHHDYCYGHTVRIIPSNPVHAEMYYIESREIR